MNRRGFALLTVLWLVAGLAAVGAAGLAAACLGAGTSRNRVQLIRAGWARNACEEILLAKYAERGSVVQVDSTDLGGAVWCEARIEEAGTRLDLNLAEPVALRALLGSDSLADALLDWRDPDDVPRPLGAEQPWYMDQGRRAPRNGPLADVAELRLIRGFDLAMVRRLEPLLTTGASEAVDVNAAPAAVVATLPGLGPTAVELILARRGVQPFRSTDELLSLLPTAARREALERYRELTARAVYSPGRVVVRVRGLAGYPALASEERLTVAPVEGRLAVIRRVLP
jgi:general secretion pathway protein K